MSGGQRFVNRRTVGDGKPQTLSTGNFIYENFRERYCSVPQPQSFATTPSCAATAFKVPREQDEHLIIIATSGQNVTGDWMGNTRSMWRPKTITSRGVKS